MKKLIHLIIFTALISFCSKSFSQEVTSTAGEYFEGANMSISWTLGEVLTETFEGNNLILTQGMQQPGITVTGLEWFTPNKLNFEVYPNPTADFVYVKNSTETLGMVSFKIFSTAGTIINNGKFNESSNKIDFSKLPSQIYILNFFDNEKVIGQCKVIKK